MSTTAAEVARVTADIEQALGAMRNQMTAFRRTATPEIMAGYPRLTAAVGREDFHVSKERSKAGIKELLDEADLLAWEVPQLLEDLFTETWMQQCFTANDIYPETTGYRIYDYLRGRGAPESPFPAHFAETLHQAFYPLGRLLQRSGYDCGRIPVSTEGESPDTSAFARLAGHYKMHPALIAGATSFGEQARRCHELRLLLRKLELKLAEEQSKTLWDEAEAERKKRS
jgi:hypothetical protein